MSTINIFSLFFNVFYLNFFFFYKQISEENYSILRKKQISKKIVLHNFKNSTKVNAHVHARVYNFYMAHLSNRK